IWLARVLAAAQTDSLSEACEVVRAQATKAFGRVTLPPHLKRSLFVAVGWTNSFPAEGWTPIAIQISNCSSSTGEFLPNAINVFQTKYQIVAAANHLLGWSAPPPSGIRKRLERSLWTHLRKGATLRGVVQHLARMVRETSKHQVTIGTELMATHIPMPQTS